MPEIRLNLSQAKDVAMLAGLSLALFAVLRPEAAGRAAESIARGIVSAAESLFVGTVKGAGSVVGLPDPATRGAQLNCCAAINTGSVFDASVSCSAGDFYNWMLSNTKPSFCRTGGASGTW
jgi:hypothetical protein